MAGSQPAGVRGSLRTLGGSSRDWDQETKDTFHFREQCSKSPGKAGGIGTFLKARANFHIFFGHNSSFHPLASSVNFITEQCHGQDGVFALTLLCACTGTGRSVQLVSCASHAGIYSFLTHLFP